MSRAMLIRSYFKIFNAVAERELLNIHVKLAADFAEEFTFEVSIFPNDISACRGYSFYIALEESVVEKNIQTLIDAIKEDDFAEFMELRL